MKVEYHAVESTSIPSKSRFSGSCASIPVGEVLVLWLRMYQRTGLARKGLEPSLQSVQWKVSSTHTREIKFFLSLLALSARAMRAVHIAALDIISGIVEVAALAARPSSHALLLAARG